MSYNVQPNDQFCAQKIIQNGYAYETNNSIYFDTAALKNKSQYHNPFNINGNENAINNKSFAKATRCFCPHDHCLAKKCQR